MSTIIPPLFLDKVADPPFDDPSSGITLRTSDGFDFYVHEAILSTASPVLKQKLSVHKVGFSYVDSENQVHLANKTFMVSIDSATLDRILRFCYPVPRPEIEDEVQLLEICRFADEYKLEGVMEAMEDEYIRLVYNEKEPLVEYAMGVMHSWAKLTSLAIRASLGHTANNLLRQGTANSTHYAVRVLSQADYHRFLQFHFVCRERISRIFLSFHSLEVWDVMKADKALTPHSCQFGRWGKSHAVFPAWLIEWGGMMGNAIIRGAPYPDLKLAQRERQLRSMSCRGTCAACDDIQRNLTMTRLVHMMDDVIEEKVEQTIDEIEEELFPSADTNSEESE
ncbi:hypothetical protein ONZ45_g15513 [Pleurotus djamor]|nr:hypothetical protein ONZ45_g15513 [Pleurotus djamor]